MYLNERFFTKLTKNLISALLVLLFSSQYLIAAAQTQPQVLAQEHMFKERKALSDVVLITDSNNIITKGNVLQIVFSCKLWSEKVTAGERVNFVAPEAIYTKEGTLLIPANSKIVATIIKIEKPKWFNKNARVYMNFECLVFPDGSAMAMSAKPFTKDGALKEGGWMSAGKIAASTVGLGAVGAGAGVGFAFIPNPAKLGTGFAIGIPVGCTVGLITGLVTPGLKYHAKAGEAIKIILCKDLCLKKVECNK